MFPWIICLGLRPNKDTHRPRDPTSYSKKSLNVVHL